MKKCNKGHYYDETRDLICPYCNNAQFVEKTHYFTTTAKSLSDHMDYSEHDNINNPPFPGSNNNPLTADNSAHLYNSDKLSNENKSEHTETTTVALFPNTHQQDKLYGTPSTKAEANEIPSANPPMPPYGAVPPTANKSSGMSNTPSYNANPMSPYGAVPPTANKPSGMSNTPSYNANPMSPCGTVPLTPSSRSINPSVHIQNVDEDESKTVGIVENTIGFDPVVGFLVCISGQHRGEYFKLMPGRNFIGRNANMNIPLTKDQSVSRDRHSIISYDIKHNKYTVSPGESRAMTYCNGELVETTQALNSNDIIEVGYSKLMFLPVCSDKFSWEK